MFAHVVVDDVVVLDVRLGLLWVAANTLRRIDYPVSVYVSGRSSSDCAC